MMKRRAICAGFPIATTGGPRIDHRVFPDLVEMDGNWAALLAGSDGKVYLGESERQSSLYFFYP